MLEPKLSPMPIVKLSKEELEAPYDPERDEKFQSIGDVSRARRESLHMRPSLRNLFFRP